MGKVSAVFYSIANIFNWIIFILALACGIFSVLSLVNVLHWEWLEPYNVGTLVGAIIVMIVCWITIWMVRKAKAEGTSKLWDVLFIIFGVVECNIFYLLGGIFGLIARK